MSVSETTRLEALWGVGVFITLLGGMGLVRLFGKRLNIYVGGLVAIVAFGLVILAGAVGNVPFFLVSVFLLGLASGLMTVSNLSFMLDMTIPQSVGLYMGAWGVANFVAQSLGNVGGALLRDIAYWVSGNVVLGYMTVFGIEIIGVALSLLLFRTITVEQFQHDAQLELVDVLAASAD
jgi:BCD family chlorophyll transporter-like MFS transporter